MSKNYYDYKDPEFIRILLEDRAQRYARALSRTNNSDKLFLRSMRPIINKAVENIYTFKATHEKIVSAIADFDLILGGIYSNYLKLLRGDQKYLEWNNDDGGETSQSLQRDNLLSIAIETSLRQICPLWPFC